MKAAAGAAVSDRDAAWVRAEARRLGFDRVHFTSVEVPEKDREFFLAWCAEGRAAGMSWLLRAPEKRADPQSFLPLSLGLISLGIRYYQGEVPPPPQAPAGRVARYAWGEDYHEAIEKRLRQFEENLRFRFGEGFVARHGLDAQPLLERAFARRAGLGFVGKNTNIIAPQIGSWIFLAEILVNVALPPDAPLAQGCGACVQCQTKCPTDALKIPYRLDARECIAYHTIENRGQIPENFRPKMGNWLFGCDDCQDVCPFNARTEKTAWPEFLPERGVGAWVLLEDILRMRTQDEFHARFRRSPLWRATRAGLVRNACIVAANGGHAGRLRAALEDCLSDESLVVRGHAAWALGRKGAAA